MKNRVIRALGIDLGTRNTLAAAWGDPPQTIPLGAGELAIPTCLLPYGGEWLYGSQARQAYEAGEESTIQIRFDLQWPFSNEGKESSVPVSEYLHEWLLYILKEVEYRLRHSGFALAVTVPFSYFNPARKILQDAALETGVENVLLVHELTACTVAWKLKTAADSKPRKAMIMTLGAGFTEAAAAHITKDEIRIFNSILSPGWGGDQCDVLVGEQILEEISKSGSLDSDRIEYKDQISLLAAVEKVRCQLSRRHTARLAVFIKNKKMEMEITRDQLNGWIGPYIELVEGMAQKILEDLSSECDLVLLSGRMAETPLLLEKITSLTGKPPILLSRDAPAMGAAFMAHHFLEEGTGEVPMIFETLPHPLQIVIPKGNGVSFHPIFTSVEPINLKERVHSRKIPIGTKAKCIGVEILQGKSFDSHHYHTRYEIQGASMDREGTSHVEMNLNVDRCGIFSPIFRDRISGEELASCEKSPRISETIPREQKVLKTVPVISKPPIPDEPSPVKSPAVLPEEKPGTKEAKVLLVKRSFACIEESMDNRGIGYEVLTPRQVNVEDFSWDRFQLVILTSASQFDRYLESIAKKLESFVQKGGRALILDWASIYITKAFPGYLSLHEETHNGMAAYIDAQVSDEKLRSQIGAAVNVDLSTGAWDPIENIMRPQDVRILLSGSYEIRNNQYQENKPLAISFPYGKGRVFFSVLNEESFSSSTGLKLLDFFLDHILS
jgi:molecular chaperone DnaK (HSP70)